MRKFTVIFIMAALILGGASSVMAEGAAVVKEFDCFISPAASGVPITLTTKDKTKAVEAASGNVNFTCRFTFDSKVYPIAKTIKKEGFTCGTQFGMTTNTNSITTPGGQVTLICKIKPPKQ